MLSLIYRIHNILYFSPLSDIAEITAHEAAGLRNILDINLFIFEINFAFYISPLHGKTNESRHSSFFLCWGL